MSYCPTSVCHDAAVSNEHMLVSSTQQKITYQFDKQKADWQKNKCKLNYVVVSAVFPLQEMQVHFVWKLVGMLL